MIVHIHCTSPAIVYIVSKNHKDKDLFLFYFFLSLSLSVCPSFLMMCYLNYKFTFDIRTEMVLTGKKKQQKTLPPDKRSMGVWTKATCFECAGLWYLFNPIPFADSEVLSVCVLHSSQKHRWRHNFLSFLKQNSVTWCIREAFV